VWRWIFMGALVVVSLLLVTLGAWEEADLGLGAALFVAALLLIEGIARVTAFVRHRRKPDVSDV